MSDPTHDARDHRGAPDVGGVVLLVALLLLLGGLLVVQSLRLARSGPDGLLILLILLVAMLAFVWLLFAFFWARGRLRASAVRALHPDAVLVEVVMTPALVTEVRQAEEMATGSSRRIWSSTYLTVAATAEALAFYGGTFRPVLRASIPASAFQVVDVKVVDFPTQTVTRHFPAMVAKAGPIVLEMLPVRTSLLIPRKLTPPQLDAACRAVARALRVP